MTRSSDQPRLIFLVAPRIHYRMTDQNAGHPPQKRRRRHKSPSSVQSALLLPVPRLADYLDTDEEGGKEAKRQKSEPTTPISTCSRHTNEYDEDMGITQVGSREAERFEEGIGPEFHDVEEEPPKKPGEKSNSGHVSTSSHGGCGSSSLQECLDRLNRATSNTLALCHSGATTERLSNPPQVMSPNVEEEQIHDQQAHDTLPEDQLLPQDESQSRVKEERKDEEVTPKSEPAAADAKEEVGDQASEDLHEELQRNLDAFPPDSEDSIGPKQVADELRRLAEEFPPVAELTEGATAPGAFREHNGPYAPRRSGRHRVRPVSPDPFTFHTTNFMEHDREGRCA